MAERRMFAKTIIDSDAFLDMPLSTQALYFHLSMRADDDGFINNPKKIQRMIGASDDDLKLLCAKRFIIPFESGIVVIKHWRIHNYIREDRRKETVYQEEISKLTVKDNGAYSLVKDVPAIECNAVDETDRQRAYRESSLPYSFEYKIRQAFAGKKCPVCGAVMEQTIDDGIVSKCRIPTIQHNIPISKGGKHELGNISVICHQCNVAIKDTETGDLNADEVIKVWDDICQSNDRQVTDKRQHRLGKDRLVEDRSDQYKRSLLESEFDGVWNIYPKKQGKKEALEAYIRARKKGVSTVDILNGIAAYKNYINIEKIDEKYIKQGSTFFRQQAWQDDWTPKRGKVIDEQDDILDGIL